MCSSPFEFQVGLHLDALLSSESPSFMSAVFPPLKELTPPSKLFLLEPTGLLIVKRILLYINLFIVPGIVLAVEE